MAVAGKIQKRTMPRVIRQLTLRYTANLPIAVPPICTV